MALFLFHVHGPHVAEISPSHLFAGQTCFKKPKPLLSDPKKMTLHCISVANLLLLQSPLESPLESPCLVNSVRDRHGPWGQKPKCAIQKIEYGLWMFMVILNHYENGLTTFPQSDHYIYNN